VVSPVESIFNEACICAFAVIKGEEVLAIVTLH